MSDYPMLISNKLHSFRNFYAQIYEFFPFASLSDAIIMEYAEKETFSTVPRQALARLSSHW